MLLEFCEEKHLCIAITWFRKADKKITYGSECTKSEIEFFAIGKIDRKLFFYVKVITWELQRNLVAVDVDKKQ